MRISDWSSDVCSSDLLTPIGHGEAHKIAVEGYHLRQVGHRKTEMAEHQIGFAVVTHDRTPVLLCCCGSRSTESMVQFAELLDPEANGFARLKPTPTATPYAGRCARQQPIAGLHRYSFGHPFELP